jgi:helicase
MTTDDFVRVRAQLPMVYRNVAYLVSELHGSYGDPILCMCATKDESRSLALQIANRFEDLDPLPPTIADLIESIQTTYPIFRTLERTLQKGVAYHNSTVPHELREKIEAAVLNKELRAISATTTLAEGIDLPFRFTILVDWLSWDSNKDGKPIQRPMHGTLFRNIAGRCGRAGVYTEGDTIIFDNPLGNQTFANSAVRDSVQGNLFLSPNLTERVTSAFDSALESGSTDYLSTFGSQFLAAIPENPASQDLVADFIANSYAGNMLTPEGLVRFEKDARTIQKEVLAGPRPLAQAASPIRLTALGRAANGSGLSPKSVERVLEFLETLPRSDLKQQKIGHILGRILQNLGDLPEQPDSDLKNVLAGKRSKLLVKTDDLPAVCEQWIEGSDVITIFLALPSVQTSKTKVPVIQWIAGTTDSEWEARYDKFVDFVSGPLESFLPWVLRSISALVEFVKIDELIDWGLWAEFAESGVDSIWAARVMGMKPPSSRQTVVAISRELPTAVKTKAPRTHTELTEESQRKIIITAIAKARKTQRVSDDDIVTFEKWLMPI